MGTLVGFVAFVVVLICLVVAGVGCSRGGSVASGPPKVVLSGEIQSLDREQVRAMLKEIARAAPPGDAARSQNPVNDHHGDVTSRLASSFLPATAVLEMTYRCNHRCLFCSCPWEAPGGGFTRLAELSLDRWKAVLRKLAEMGVSQFAFTGGEPLLKERLPELIEYAASCVVEHVDSEAGALRSHVGPPKLYLLSNGSAVNWAVLDLCQRFGMQLSMSLPGLASYHTHTQQGSPDTILRNFRQAEARGIPTVVNITVTRKNLGELYQTIAAAFLAGARQLLLNRFLPGGRGLEHAAELMLDRAQVRKMLDVAEEALRDSNRHGSVGTELPKCAFDPSHYLRLEVGTRCSAAIQFFVVDPSGYIRACNHSPHRIGHVDEIHKVKTDPYWARFIRKEYLPTACAGCASAGDCDGGCREAAHVVSGSVDAPDPLMQLSSCGSSGQQDDGKARLTRQACPPACGS